MSQQTTALIDGVRSKSVGWKKFFCNGSGLKNSGFDQGLCNHSVNGKISI